MTDYEEKAKELSLRFYKGGIGRQRDIPIFDRAKMLGTRSSGLFNVEFRRTEADRRPAAKSVTRKLMGDPAPGRTPWAQE